ncbi:unnamed protein product [Alternaria alternata]
MQADPGQSPMGWDTEPPSGVQASGPCDLCFIKNLQKQAGSPYYDEPQIRESSLYESKTSSCGVTGYPLSISSLPFPQLPIASPTPTSSVCSGEEYDIQTGDDCYKISKSQSIGTAWLLSDNSLTAYCADFPQNGKLCIKNTCKVYTVQPADTCELMASSNNITIAQLKAWNPIINAGCHNLYKMNGTSICISNPGVAYVTPPAMPPLAPSTAVSAAPVPTNAKDESNRQCGQWYNVESGDYCNLVTMRYAIAMADFVFLNPSINANCTNLLLDISYCVAPVGDINTYSGRPGYHTPGPSGLPFTKVTFTPTKPATTTSTPTQLSLAIDTRDDCYQYFDASQMESDITGTLYRHQCDLAADVYGVEVSELLTWNPSLGNDTEALTCSFEPGVRYCGRFYFEPPKAGPEVGTSLDFPIREGYDTDCTEFRDVSKGFTCEDVLALFGLTLAQFFKMNPAVGSTCANLWTETAYCVKSPNAPPPATSISPTSVAPSSTVAPGPGAPTHTGQPANCVRWHIVEKGDDCSILANKYFITLEQFYAWNPAVSNDCRDNFWQGSAYCVGTSNSISVSRSALPPSPTPSAFVIPSPNQANNAIKECNKVAQAQEGDWCALFAERNGISDAQLYAWNAVLDNGNACGSSFWKDYWYCVGVAA